MTQTEFQCTCGLVLEKPDEGQYRECVGCTTLYKTVEGHIIVVQESQYAK